ncbi:MAG: quaternary ammonium compound efflux SMR transporter SugE [Phycisphaeraceae bacterium]|nr:quaternary ammonium compound efflux SMR transporter SugE [Phycisphaeraceae bacterium]
MHWLLLFIAGLLEIGWAVGLKYSQGFTRPVPSVLTVVALALSMFFLALAVRHLPLGTAYAVWTGIGTVGAAALGIILFKEPAGALRIMCIALIVVGIIGLKFTASRPAL